MPAAIYDSFGICFGLAMVGIFPAGGGVASAWQYAIRGSDSSLVREILRHDVKHPVLHRALIFRPLIDDLRFVDLRLPVALAVRREHLGWIDVKDPAGGHVVEHILATHLRHQFAPINKAAADGVALLVAVDGGGMCAGPAGGFTAGVTV